MIPYVIPNDCLCVNDGHNAWSMTVVQGRGVRLLWSWRGLCSCYTVNHGFSKHGQTLECTLQKYTVTSVAPIKVDSYMQIEPPNLTAL